MAWNIELHNRNVTKLFINLVLFRAFILGYYTFKWVRKKNHAFKCIIVIKWAPIIVNTVRHCVKVFCLTSLLRLDESKSKLRKPENINIFREEIIVPKRKLWSKPGEYCDVFHTCTQSMFTWSFCQIITLLGDISQKTFC